MQWLINAINEKIIESNNHNCKCEDEGDTNGVEAWGGYTSGLRWVLYIIDPNASEIKEGL